MESRIHIITLNVPYPPDYGGIIDSFYRIKDLHLLGIKIYLHCFIYNKPVTPELEKYCERVYYYKRDKTFIRQFSFLPFIVKSRLNKQLLKNLLYDDNPILFDGLHVAGYLKHPSLSGRIKIVRAHNIEHEYYFNLAKNEKSYIKRLYFLLESLRLKRFERALNYANGIATVSTTDQSYFSSKYGNSSFIPSSHPFADVVCKEGRGGYILYHGDLSVNENEQVVLSIINDISQEVKYPFVIAGKNPTARLLREAGKFGNVEVIANPDTERMTDLIANAHIHFLPVLSPCGLKLKLLFALYAGRFCVVNQNMVHGTNLAQLCHMGDTNTEFTAILNSLINQSFTKEEIAKRNEYLNEYYNPLQNARKFVDLFKLN